MIKMIKERMFQMIKMIRERVVQMIRERVIQMIRERMVQMIKMIRERVFLINLAVQLYNKILQDTLAT